LVIIKKLYYDARATKYQNNIYFKKTMPVTHFATVRDLLGVLN